MGNVIRHSVHHYFNPRRDESRTIPSQAFQRLYPYIAVMRPLSYQASNAQELVLNAVDTQAEAWNCCWPLCYSVSLARTLLDDHRSLPALSVKWGSGGLLHDLIGVGAVRGNLVAVPFWIHPRVVPVKRSSCASRSPQKQVVKVFFSR